MSKAVAVREHDDIRIIDVNGDLDCYVSGHLSRTLKSLVRQKIYKLIVNLSNVEYINSVSVGDLVGISAQVRQKRGDLKVCGLTDSLQRTFDLVGASKVLEVYSSEADAIASRTPP